MIQVQAQLLFLARAGVRAVKRTRGKPAESSLHASREERGGIGVA